MYSLYVGFNLGGLSSVYSELKRAAGGAARIFAVIDRAPAMPLTADAQVWEPKPPAPGVAALPVSPVPSAPAAAPGVASPGLRSLDASSVAGALSFRGVSFAYPARPGVPVLSDFSLDVPPRTHIALVGASGSGKSTAAALVARLYDPAAGTVELDGEDIRKLDPTWLRGAVVGYVPQASATAGGRQRGPSEGTDCPPPLTPRRTRPSSLRRSPTTSATGAPAPLTRRSRRPRASPTRTTSSPPPPPATGPSSGSGACSSRAASASASRLRARSSRTRGSSS